METDDPMPRLFERTRVDAPASVAASARELATQFVGKADRLPLAPGDFAGPYEIVGILGAGGQAVVYEGRHATLDRRVAIKVPRKDVGDRLTKEAKLVAQLVHGSIVQVFDLSLDGPVPFLVLELCEKGSLDERLEVVSPDGLPLEQVVAVARSVLEALAFAHERGVVHRDVKPANVLFDAENRAKVADFGIGTIAVADDLALSHELSKNSLAAGTPLYLAPEQENPALREEGRIDGRADLFSFGKVLFQMLTGASPRTIRPPSRLRPGLAAVWDDYVFKLTEERPERRFQSAREALEALPGLKAPARTPPPRPAVPELAFAPGYRLLDEQPHYDQVGPTYRARDEKTGRAVTVRVLDEANPTTARRIVFDVRRISRIEHPNVARVYTIGETNDRRPFFVVERVEGRTLDRVLADGAPLPWSVALRFAVEIAYALAAAHEMGVLHRDLKPENIIVTDEGHVKLANIGFARDLNSEMKLTADGALVGTPLYVAPEIGRVKKLDGRADMYSLGLIVYEMLTGRNPLRACSALEILSAKAHDRIPPIEERHDVPEPVRRVVAKMLEKDRGRRHGNAMDLVRDLRAAQDGRQPARAPAPPPSARRMATVAAVAVLAAIVGLIVTTALMTIIM